MSVRRICTYGELVYGELVNGELSVRRTVRTANLYTAKLYTANLHTANLYTAKPPTAVYNMYTCVTFLYPRLGGGKIVNMICKKQHLFNKLIVKLNSFK